MAKKLTSNKAKEILHDKTVHGHPITDQQRKFFGAIAGGAKPYKQGGWLDKFASGGELQGPKVAPVKVDGTEVFEHGEDTATADKLENGVNPTDLTKKGIKYAEGVGKEALKRGKENVITSDIERAKQTANVIGQTANLPVYTNPLLRTWDIGEYDGAPEGSFKEKDWVKHPNTPIPGGESFDNFKQRMEKAFDFVENAPKTDDVVTHSKVTRAFKALHSTGGQWTDATTKKFEELKKESKGNSKAKDGMNLEKIHDNYGKHGNYNDASASTGPGFVGLGYNTKGRNYSPAWGGQFQDGGFLDAMGKGVKMAMLDPKTLKEELKKTGNQVLTYLANTGWGKEKLKNFARNADPYSYEHGLDASAAQRAIAASFYNEKEQQRKALDEKMASGKGLAEDSVRLDLLNRYAGLPEKYGTLQPSQFTPTMGNKYTQYTSSPQIERMIKSSFPKEGLRTKEDVEKFAASQALVKEDPNNPGHYIPMKGKGSNYVATLPALGSATYGVGEDKSGPYLSYSDKWDLNPYHGAYAQPGEGSTSADKIGRWLIGNEKGDVATKHIGNPPDVYGRIYFDPKTGQPKDIKPTPIMANAPEPVAPAITDVNKILPLALGNKMQMGGTMPGAVGFSYGRVAGSAPANGKYAKKTKASAQNGQEMKFYQEGLDWTPKTISQNGAIIDPMGQWAHPGETTIIPSNEITMKGVNYDVIGESNTGDKKLMKPGKKYKFDGDYVTETPKGGWLEKYK